MALLVASLVLGELSLCLVPAIRTWPFVPIQVYQGAPRDWVVRDVRLVVLTEQGERGLVESGLASYNLLTGLKRLAKGGPDQLTAQVEVLDRYLRQEAARHSNAGQGPFLGFKVHEVTYDLTSGERAYGRCLVERSWR